MSSVRTNNGPADIVTYRHNGKLVYVKPGDDYEQALDFAQKEYPEELGRVARDRISFTIAATMGGERSHVRISESAWKATISRLLRGELIDVHLRPEEYSNAELSEKDSPPHYLEVPRTDSKEQIRCSRSSPPSRAPSRTPSPSGRSERGKSWFRRP